MSIVIPSDQTECYETPRKVFDPLNAEFCFDLDAAASEENALCPVYLTEEDDALAMKEWPGTRCFLNPPYGKKLKLFVRKAFEQAFLFHKLVVLYIPAHTSEAWFHTFCYEHDGIQIRFQRGRTTFGLPDWMKEYRKQQGKKPLSSCRFPLIVVIMDGRTK